MRHHILASSLTWFVLSSLRGLRCRFFVRHDFGPLLSWFVTSLFLRFQIKSLPQCVASLACHFHGSSRYRFVTYSAQRILVLPHPGVAFTVRRTHGSPHPWSVASIFVAAFDRHFFGSTLPCFVVSSIRHVLWSVWSLVHLVLDPSHSWFVPFLALLGPSLPLFVISWVRGVLG